MRPPPQPGTLIGSKYLLDRLLGQGGMGSVFAAQNTLTGKQVAIKCLNPDVATSPEASLRFKREAKASARVRHPNVVDVYDVISEDGAFFLIMEYLEGETLASLLASRATSLPDLIRFVTAAMRGVAAAHREGVIHRDIKPENIFLAREGDHAQVVPKVLDFGISKIQGTQDLGLTAPGAALGTVLYMSIEQLHGVSDLDVRADVYAFGVILYQAVTGCAPFEAETLPALIMRIMTEHATPVKELRPDVPPKLAQIIEWAMARERDNRLPTLDRFSAELEPFSDDARYHYQLTRPFRTTPVPRAPTQHAEVRATEPSSSARRVPTHFAAQSPLPAPVTSETPFATTTVGEQPGPAQTLLRAVLAMVVLSGLTLVGWRLWQARSLAQPHTVNAINTVRELFEPVVGAVKQATTGARESATAASGNAAAENTVQDRTIEADIDNGQRDALQPVHKPLEVVEGSTTGPSTTATETDTRAVRDPQNARNVSPQSTTRLPVQDERATHRATVKRLKTLKPRAPGPEAAERRVLTPVAPPNAVETAQPPANQVSCNPKFYLDSEGEKHFKPECYR